MKNTITILFSKLKAIFRFACLLVIVTSIMGTTVNFYFYFSNSSIVLCEEIPEKETESGSEEADFDHYLPIFFGYNSGQASSPYTHIAIHNEHTSIAMPISTPPPERV